MVDESKYSLAQPCSVRGCFIIFIHPYFCSKGRVGGIVFIDAFTGTLSALGFDLEHFGLGAKHSNHYGLLSLPQNWHWFNQLAARNIPC